MKIETLDKLLKEQKSPTAFARVPNSKNGERAHNKVEVAFSGDGRIYTYKSSIFDVAERLDLIPEIYAGDEGQRIADNFFDGIRGYVEAIDTVRYLVKTPAGKDITFNVVGQDEFDRDIAEFFVEDSAWV